MSWLRNTWYAAGLSEELGEVTLLGRRILGEPILLYRDDAQVAVAIGDRCPHRFAPLHKGKIIGGHVRCGYHGLSFDSKGKCIHNPHGPIGSLSVPSYPLVERSGVLWIWLGERNRVDTAQIPEFECLDTERFHIGYGYLYGAANYELMSDNILDLSHIEFLHPALGTEQVSRAKVDTRLIGNKVITTRRMTGEILPTNLARVYGTGERRVNRTMEVCWQPPSTMLLSVSIETDDENELWQTGSHSLHLFTPETDNSTHYFYVGSLPRNKADEAVHSAFFSALARAFVAEDKPMIDAQQMMIGTADIMDLKPSLLAIDKAAALARRTIQKMVEYEASCTDRSQVLMQR